jgi:hypothetical protein
LLPEQLLECSGDDLSNNFTDFFDVVQAVVVSVQARVIRRRLVFRDYAFLPVKLQGARGYLGGEYFMFLKDLKAKCKREWRFTTLVRDYNSVRNNSGCAIGNGWSRGKYCSWSGS